MRPKRGDETCGLTHYALITLILASATVSCSVATPNATNEPGGADAADVTSAAAQRPTWTFRVSFGEDDAAVAVYVPYPIPVRFVGLDRVIVPRAVRNRDAVFLQGEIWSVERGKPVTTLPGFPDHFDPVAPRVALCDGKRSIQIFDLVTGTSSSLAGVIDSAHERSWALMPGCDAVAVFIAPAKVEIRSTTNGTLRNVVTLPEPPERKDSHQRYYEIDALLVSADGNRLAVAFNRGSMYPDVRVCDLTTGVFGAPIEQVDPIGFTPNSLVCLKHLEDGTFLGCGYAPTILHADGSQEGLSDATLERETACALSASGEVLAFLARDVPKIIVRVIGNPSALTQLSTRRNRDLYGLALSPQGERLAVVYTDGLIDVYELGH